MRELHEFQPYPEGSNRDGCVKCPWPEDNEIHTRFNEIYAEQAKVADGGEPLSFEPATPQGIADAVRVTATGPDGEQLGAWTTHEDGRHVPDPPLPSTELSTYVDKAMFEAEALEEGALERPRVHLLSATPDPLGSVAAFSMIYEGRVVRDLSEITDDERRHYFDEAFKTTLKAPLEAIDFHFMVEGLTRASWDQMVRQRTAVFGGESLRFAVKEDLNDSVRPGPMVRTKRQREIHSKAVAAVHEAYLALIADGVPAEDARGLLPLNVLTRGHWKTNLRNMEAEIGKRTCTQAQFEWRLIAADLRRAIREYGRDPHAGMREHGYTNNYTRTQALHEGSNPGSARGIANANWQFEYIADSDMFQPICFSTGKCMFKAQMDRGCTIRERVEAGRFEEIDPREWATDPTAAWVR